jgi:hypothetical protein
MKKSRTGYLAGFFRYPPISAIHPLFVFIRPKIRGSNMEAG